MRKFNDVKRVLIQTSGNSARFVLYFISDREEQYNFEFPFSLNSKPNEILSKIRDMEHYLSFNPINKIESEMKAWHRVKNEYTIYLR